MSSIHLKTDVPGPRSKALRSISHTEVPFFPYRYREARGVGTRPELNTVE